MQHKRGTRDSNARRLLVVACIAALAFGAVAFFGARWRADTSLGFPDGVQMIFGLSLAGLAVVALPMSALGGRDLRRKRAETKLAAAEERYWELFERMSDAVFGLADDGRVVFANQRAIRLTGYSREQLLSMTYTDLLSEGHAQRFAHLLQGAHEADDIIDTEIISATGRAIPVEIGVSDALFGLDERGLTCIARDMTERRLFEEQLMRLASRDHLTGLFNRRRFEEELSGCVERALRTGRPGALLWLDLDRFKEINDSMGHHVGDSVLVGVADVLVVNNRAGNTVARLGGDEFAVLMPEATLQEARMLADRLLSKVHGHVFTFDEKHIRVTTSVGIVSFPEHASKVDELLARADLAMYRAKDEGRNCCSVCLADDERQIELRAQFDWIVAIEEALAQNAFVVEAQPIIDLESSEVDRFELLIRMENPDGGLIQPDEFLPVAERVGLIADIDCWMAQHAIELLALNAEGERPLRLDINVSGKAIGSTALLEVIRSELELTGVDPGRFGVEITETAAVNDMARARGFVENLKRLGCRVALDDFGSGYSSIYYLNHLPVDSLKIDGGFVKGLVNNSKGQRIVRAMVDLSRGFGVDSTAEYVEDAGTLELLRSFGVRYAQGFHIGPPGPEGDAIRSIPERAAIQ